VSTAHQGAITDRGCALVTGASRGLGAAIARGLAADGWAVGVNYRVDDAAADGVLGEIRDAGGEAIGLRADVRARQTPDGLIAALEREFGRRVLVLVNNAGITADGLLPRLGDEAWQTVIDTNLTAPFRLTRRALWPMIRERFGRVVNIASAAGLQANPGQANYAASKAGLIGFTKTAAAEVARWSVTVNAIAPGAMATDSNEGVLDSLVPRVPAQRAGAPEEVAACVRFLASEDAGYVTGAVLPVDGGLVA